MVEYLKGQKLLNDDRRNKVMGITRDNTFLVGASML